MRILLLNDSIGTGSVGKIVNSIYRGVVNSGHECKIAYGRTNNTSIPKNDIIKIGNTLSVFWDAFLTRLFGKSGTHSFFSTKKAMQQISEFSPDLINVHSFYGYYVDMKQIMEYANKNRIPVVLTLHSCWDFTGHCCYFSMNSCESWKSGCAKCRFFRTSYPKSLIYDSTRKNYSLKQEMYSLTDTHVVSPSVWMCNLAKESLLKHSSFYVIKNGLDLSVYKKNNVVKFKKPTVLCVANVWDKRKGLEDVIELSNYLGSDVDVVVVGLSKKQIRELPKSILGIEKTSCREELVDLYNKATIFFNPTYEDNYPTVNIEAQACGLPVVTYNSGGAPETIISENSGIAVFPKDYKSVKNYLYEVVKKTKEFEINNLALSDERMAKDYLELFKKIIASRD